MRDLTFVEDVAPLLGDETERFSQVGIPEGGAEFRNFACGKKDASSFRSLLQFLDCFNPVLVDNFRDSITMVSVVNGRSEKIFPREFAETLMGFAPAVHGSWNGHAVDAVMGHGVKAFAIEIRRREFLRRPSTCVQPVQFAGL